MEPSAFLQDLQQRIVELLRASPAVDLERNLKALLTQSLGRMDVVTREEFELALARIEALRQRVHRLEQALASSQHESRRPD